MGVEFCRKVCADSQEDFSALINTGLFGLNSDTLYFRSTRLKV
jgi:hypothetical protein